MAAPVRNRIRAAHGMRQSHKVYIGGMNELREKEMRNATRYGKETLRGMHANEAHQAQVPCRGQALPDKSAWRIPNAKVR